MHSQSRTINLGGLGRKEELLLRMAASPRLAHQVLFQDRHWLPTPQFQWDIIDLWHSDHQKVVIQAFRGAAKSTTAEEAILIQGLFKRYKNAIILGETWNRACDRLRAIKHQVENNDYIEELFGDQKGETWTEDKILLRNGVIIQAYGRGQSLRGAKHLAHRPDRAFLDDIEDDDSTATEEAIEKTRDWFMGTVLPALTKGATIRVNGTPLKPNALICQLAKDEDWISRVYPVRVVDPERGTVSIWPELHSVEEIDKMEAFNARMGTSHKFQQEMLCRPEDPASKPFTSQNIKVEPAIRTWQPTYAMVDPARTVRAKKKSAKNAMTGIAVWSWIGNRFTIWDAFGGFWHPDTIVSKIMEINEKFSPVVIGVESNGLEEFILQPLRHEQVKRCTMVPVRAIHAPKDQTKFIASLKPFFDSGEITFAKECSEARSQLLNFPTGRRDIPNALAYALILRPGLPVYDNFGFANVELEMPCLPGTIHLAVNSDGRCTTAAMVQLADGAIRVVADWVREGDPGTNLARIVEEAGILAEGNPIRLCAPVEHFLDNDIGLRHAARQIPVEVHRGGDVPRGREDVRERLSRMVRGRPAVLVSGSARWSLNAFSGGFAREIKKGGVLGFEPKEGVYRVLMEGIEAFASAAKAYILNDELPRNYGTTPDGRQYLSARVTDGKAP